MSQTSTMPRITSYADAERVLNGRSQRRINHNTRIERRSDTAIAIKLHDTDVVVWHQTDAGDVIVLDHGGWPTVTTKDRINESLPGGWYLDGSVENINGPPKKWRPWVITNGRPWLGESCTIAEFYRHIAIPVNHTSQEAVA